MKRTLLLVSLLTLGTLNFILPTRVAAQVNPVPSLLNFQGRLTKPDGTPVADGTYSLRFSLWDAATGGTEKWNQTINSIAVKNATFAVLLNVNTPNLFDADRWLEIQIGSDAPLTPRQQLVSVAFALKANSVPDGSIGAAQLADGSITAAKFASGANAPGGNAGGDLTGTYPNPLLATLASSLAKVSGGVLTSDGSNLGIGGNRYLALSPNDKFPYDSKQMAHYGLGWFQDTWYTGGPTCWLSGYGGMKFFTSGVLRLSLTRGGNFGIGTDAPSRKLDVRGGDIALTNASGALRSLVAVNGSSDAGYFQIFNSANALIAGLGGDSNGGEVFVRDGTGTPSISLTGSTGELTAKIVTVLGGSDVAEPYHVAAAGEIKAVPGMVVCIDGEKVGQMKVAGKAYDKTVAGIVSGANGINPGITLRQKGTVADGELPVASIGRVWCWCDADANGAIEAGDMLTTSDTPGHAMKVSDHNKANGAVIGKAMSSLKSGKGLVLVLVSLK